MTTRSLLLVPVIAAAMALAPNVAAIAQNDEKSEPPPSSQQNLNPQEPNALSDNTSPGPQNAPSNNQSDKQEASSDKDRSPASPQTDNQSQNQTKSNNQAPDNNNSRTDGQDSTNRDAKTDSQQRGDRSVLNDRKDDNQTDRSTTNANRDATNRTFGRDNQTNARNDKNRDFRRDFKFGREVNRGLAIASIVRGSIFYDSGLRDGDVIVSYNGRPIRTQNDFGRFVVYQPGQRVPIVVLRDGREETIYVQYRDDVARHQSGGRVHFGAEFDPRVDDAVVIIRVDEGSPAAQAGLQVNDVIIALGGDRVSSPRDALALIESTNPGERLTVEFSRHGRTEVMLGGPAVGGTTRTETNVYRQADGGASIGVGVDGENRRIDDDKDRDSEDRDRRDERRGGRGLLPRLRN